MTCPPFCSNCGGNLGHPQNGDELCAKCKPMTDNNTLLKLAEQCEQATGPDRELDAAISEALGNCLHTPVVQEVSWSDGTKDLVPVCTKCGAKNAYQEWHRFTASLDSAMTLVPEEYDFYVADDKHGVHACVNAKPPISGGSLNAATPALALCAAALRAKAAAQ